MLFDHSGIVKGDDKKLHIAYFNARSVPAHIIDINALLAQKIYDFVLVSETWLFADAVPGLFHVSGYNIFRRDRVGRRGGGVAAYVRNDLKVEVLDFDGSDEVEQLWLSVKLNLQKVAIGIVYRPPQVLYTALDSLVQPLEHCFLNFSHVIFAGDFNIDFLDVTNIRRNYLSNIIESYNFHQVITQATRVTSSSSKLLDLLFVSKPSLIADSIFTLLDSKLPT